MKTIYLLLISFVLLYADNFKEILLLQINNPHVLDSYHNDEVAVAYCKKEILIILQKKILSNFLKKLGNITIFHWLNIALILALSQAKSN